MSKTNAEQDWCKHLKALVQFTLKQYNSTDKFGHGKIGSVSAKGVLARSYICAGTLPDAQLMNELQLDLELPYFGSFGSIGKVKFGAIDFVNASADFGLYAVSEIKKFKAGRNFAKPQDYFKIEFIT